MKTLATFVMAAAIGAATPVQAETANLGNGAAIIMAYTRTCIQDEVSVPESALYNALRAMKDNFTEYTKSTNVIQIEMNALGIIAWCSMAAISSLAPMPARRRL